MQCLGSLIPYKDIDDCIVTIMDKIKNKKNFINDDYEKMKKIISSIEKKKIKQLCDEDINNIKRILSSVDEVKVKNVIDSNKNRYVGDKYVCDIMEICVNEINKYKEMNIEVEFRLGMNSQNDFMKNRFISCVNEEFFIKLGSTLQMSNIWSKTSMKKTKNVQDKNGIRCIDMSGVKKYLRKHRLVNIDMVCLNSPFVIRMSISREEDCDGSGFDVGSVGVVRNIDRISYVYQDKWSYDLSRILYNDNTIDMTKYEVELEFVDMASFVGGRYGGDYVVHSGLLKMRDMIKMIWNSNSAELKLEFHSLEKL